ncbi:nucleotidyltransferase domain-containing protein [Candidatus Dependentiae bacterium]|nr:nucleotidyltransferase domain-containing protein [Candidatus Dependentiae bacterium]
MIDVKSQLITIIHRHVPDCKIMLFGSRARGTHKEGADYDVAIDVGYKIPFATMLRIWDDVEESDIHVQVDVVDLHSVDADFLEEVHKDAILWT